MDTWKSGFQAGHFSFRCPTEVQTLHPEIRAPIVKTLSLSPRKIRTPIVKTLSSGPRKCPHGEGGGVLCIAELLLAAATHRIQFPRIQFPVGNNFSLETYHSAKF